ncbi:MAG: acetate--CoA ligase family protein [Mycobacteriales bacterium]
MTSVLDSFLQPAGIAIVGATDERYYARSLIRNLLAAGFPAENVYPVHPRHETVGGLTCYADLASIPNAVDLVVVITRADTVAEIIREAGKIGASAALVLADGFAEQGEAGRKLQEELAVTAGETGVAVLGPNTLGFLAPPEGVGAWAAGELSQPLIPGSVGVVFQSSGILNLFLTLSVQRRLGIRAAFSTGNEVSVDVADLVEYFARDDKTRVIAMVLETTTRPRRLIAALKLARSMGKPVVMLKLGASERARRNAVAHTGRMASSASAWEAMLRRLDVVLVHDHDELVEAAALFDAAPSPDRSGGQRPAGAALVTISGGDCSLLADLAEREGLPLADLTPETVTQLADVLEKPGLLGNPLDCENLHQTDYEAFLEAVGILCGDPGVDIVGFRLNLPSDPTDRLRKLYRDATTVARECGVEPVVLSRASEPLAAEWFTVFSELGVPFLPAFRPAVTVMSRWCARSEPAIGPDVALESVPEHVSAPSQGTVASWQQTQEFLGRAGIPYAPCALVSTQLEAVTAAATLPYPLVAKLISPDAPHKSDLGGVITGLGDEAAVAEAFTRLQGIAAENRLPLEGVELQAMISGGFEMILGLKVDPVVGPLLLVGVGGVLAEVTHDVVLDVPTLDQQSAEQLIRRLTSAPLFAGYRGRDRLDISAFASIVVKLAEFSMQESGQILELDLNPVLVMPQGQGAVAVDALAVVP